jgi:hypothetical protein
MKTSNSAPIIRQVLFNRAEIAQAVRVSPGTISAMKRSGLRFSHGRLTKLDAVLHWMEEHPDWRTREAYPRVARAGACSRAPRAAVVQAVS